MGSEFNANSRRFAPELWSSSQDTNESDIFLVSFPKSGNTWVRFMMTGIFYMMDLSVKSGKIVNDLVPDLDQYDVYTRYLNTMCFKSHKLPQAYMRKVLYVYRDGRDALCSYKNMREKMDISVDMDSLISEATKIQGTTWNEHIRTWLDNPYQATVTYLKYEDLRASPLEEMQRVLGELDIAYDTDHLQKVIDNCNIQEMKGSALKDPWNVNSVMKERGAFIHKGETGGFEKKLSPAQMELFNRKNAGLLNELGYPL